MTENDRKTLTLQSNSDEVQHIKPFIKELQQWIGFDDKEFSRIRLALNEAVMNAIKHGNKNSPTKKVYIKAEKNDRTVLIYVKDEGKGFDVTAIPNPTDEDNILKPSGRGVF